jgi:mycothione reductase
MNDFDLVVLGGGTGNIVASEAADAGLDVALVERGPLGGTCLNRGCNPSKHLIHRADVVETITESDTFGITSHLDDIAFEEIVTEINETMRGAAERKAQAARDHPNVTLYQTDGEFVDERTIQVSESDTTDEAQISGEKVVLAGGSRPLIPSIDGLDEVEYLTSADALSLDEQPDQLVIVGGGYIAAELGYFYGAMGTDVTIVGHSDTLVAREDRDISERFTEIYEQRYDVHTGYEVTAVTEDDDEIQVQGEDAGDEETIEVRGDTLLLATGRRPNTDTWNIASAGIETDEDGFVETNDHLETSTANVWAIGDIAGNYMFKHSGDREAKYVLDNAVHEKRRAITYPGMAHAIFSSPQIGSLGQTEDALEDADQEFRVGTYAYEETALGSALNADEGFAKVLATPDGEILGCHIIGPHASMLIHEVSTAVAVGATAEDIAETIHIHPALNEVVQGAFTDCCNRIPTGF